MWSKLVEDLFKSLGMDKGEWLEDILSTDADSSSSSFLFFVYRSLLVKERV